MPEVRSSSIGSDSVSGTPGPSALTFTSSAIKSVPPVAVAPPSPTLHIAHAGDQPLSDLGQQTQIVSLPHPVGRQDLRKSVGGLVNLPERQGPAVEDDGGPISMLCRAAARRTGSVAVTTKSLLGNEPGSASRRCVANRFAISP
ncbi:hypothetical protein SVIO_027690 [Streptomyces violaceusniger]|uniref:Uncharacterized protein n=1 Tax=Streptomyces violaceusniger TaxID=68280 RepID=A0A4D4KZ19_STRVO|nr:hypothetical protein SVIO_027690 [Streptomyces violaceusniger]